MNASAWTLHFSFAWRVTFLYFLPPFNTSSIWSHLRKPSWSGQMGTRAPGGYWLTQVSLPLWVSGVGTVCLCRGRCSPGTEALALCVGWDSPCSGAPSPSSSTGISTDARVWWVQAQVWAGRWCRGGPASLGNFYIYLFIYYFFNIYKKCFLLPILSSSECRK